MRRIVLPCIFLLLSFSTIINSYGQSIQNVVATLLGNDVRINYDLLATDDSQAYDITIYSSFNNFSSALRLVSGDIGPGVAPGQGKSIIWRASQEIVAFDGDLVFEIRGSPSIAIGPEKFRFTMPTVGSSFKVGKSMPVSWDGGDKNQNVGIELYKSNSMVQGIATQRPNSGSFNWTVPKEMAKGTDYKVRLFNMNDPKGAVFSTSFKIKGKMPVYVYFIPVAVAGGVVAALLAGGGSDPELDCTNPCSNVACPGYDVNTCTTTRLVDPPTNPDGG